ncbi:Gfo/Idh/MocA family oxidoreductase [archaeon]|jgi:UDP-N-acetylglucosamine 3-dehydrogenase|nr:Gfo/Idh/MocA family oxidoreductase [archaeon]MBT6762378.1 Gfo/Idh/MocA family oxidoreductase [archaeon]
MIQTPINVAVIGLGNMGKHHARNYFQIDSANLIAVCDLNENLAKTTAKKFNCKAYATYQEMLDNESIQAVSIVVPTKFHASVAIECMKRGIDVLVEKPIAPTIQEAEEIIQSAKENNRILQIGHIERYNPAVQKLKALLDMGKLGEVTSIIARRVGAVPVQVRDMNVIIDLAVHDIDIINYLYNSQPTAIGGNIGKAIIEKREDYADIFLKYNNKSGFIQVNWITPVKIRNLTVTGSKGYAELNYITQELVVYASNFTKEGTDEYGDHVVKFALADKTIVGVEHDEPLKLELEDFLESVNNRKTPLVDGIVGLQTLRIALHLLNQG